MVFSVAECFLTTVSPEVAARQRSASGGVRINRDEDPARNGAFWEEQRRSPGSRAKSVREVWFWWCPGCVAFLEDEVRRPLERITRG